MGLIELSRDHKRINDYLMRDQLRHIVPLKMWKAYGEHVQVLYASIGAEEGVMLHFPSVVSSFDAQTYPMSEHVLLVHCDGLLVARALLEHAPSGTLVAKVAGKSEREAILEHFAAERVSGVLSYTSGGELPAAPSDIVESERPDPRVLPLYEAQDHSAAWLNALADRGELRCFTRFQGDEPIATCFTFCNFGRIWEIGGVFTQPDYRRQGHGHAVVTAALHSLAKRKLIPRYQLHESNRNSQKLAESLGLRLFLTTEHFLCRAKRA
jgi:Acetyltransferases, including N-acetylases of ribosomal proteins